MNMYIYINIRDRGHEAAFLCLCQQWTPDVAATREKIYTQSYSYSASYIRYYRPAYMVTKATANLM